MLPDPEGVLQHQNAQGHAGGDQLLTVGDDQFAELAARPELALRLDYGDVAPWLRHLGDHLFTATGGWMLRPNATRFVPIENYPAWSVNAVSEAVRNSWPNLA